jgi:hypothetical protein
MRRPDISMLLLPALTASHVVSSTRIFFGGRDMARVMRIFVCPQKGMPMCAVDAINAIAGVGLEGDRYALKTGTYSAGHRPIPRHVTIFSAGKLLEANIELAQPFLPEETRRNIMVEGDIDLPALVGREFAIGGVRMRGVEDCAPCALPSKMVSKPGFARAFNGRGGIRAEILSSGFIAVGDELRPPDFLYFWWFFISYISFDRTKCTK